MANRRAKMKNFLYFLVGFLFMLCLVVFCDKAFGAELSFGGGLLNGHSYDGSYSIDTGYHLGFTLEQSHIKWDRKINTGIMYLYSHYNQTNNDPHKELKRDAHVLTGFIKPYWRLSEGFQPFVLVGIGGAIDKVSSRFSFTGGLGLDCWLSKNWALSPAAYLIVTETNNFRVGLISLKYHF